MLKAGAVRFVNIFLLLFLAACQKEVNFGEHDYKPLGTAAHDLLSSSLYSSLTVQISYMPGYDPGNAAIDELKTYLNTYLNKPGGILVKQQQIQPSGKSTLSLEEIVQIEKTSRSVFTMGDNICVHILITDGNYTNLNALGTSYWNTSSCIFGKAIYDNSGAAGQVSRTQLMSTMLEHEFGHLLGLVDQGSPMQTAHRDNDNGAHCDNANCLMYHVTETNPSGMTGIPQLDINCRNDLKANGGK